MKVYKQLTKNERFFIDHCFNVEHLSIRTIAQMLGKNPSTISREIKKGGFKFSFLKAFNIRRTEFPTYKIVDSFDGLGTLLARNFVRDMKSITSPIAEAVYDATNPLIGFQRWFISLDEGAQKTISAVITNAERYLKNGALVEAVDEFAKIDEVMNNFIKSGGVGEDQIAWMQKVGDSVIEALNAPIKWSANMMNYLRTLMHENHLSYSL